MPMTHGTQKSHASHTGQTRQYVKSQPTAQNKDRLKGVPPNSRQAAIRRILEETTDKAINKEFVHNIDGIYNELLQSAGVNPTSAAAPTELADPLLQALAPLGKDINGIVALIYIAVYTTHQNLRAYTEKRLFHCIFDLKVDTRQLSKSATSRLLVMTLLNTDNLCNSTHLQDCEARIAAAATLAAELLTRDEETPGSGKKEKNDVVNNILNLKLETRNMKKLLNKAQWEALCTDLRFYALQPPLKQIPKFVNGLRRACDYVAFNSDVDPMACYVNLITSNFLNTRFQVDLLLNFIDIIGSQYQTQNPKSKRKEQFEKIVAEEHRDSVALVLWIIDTDILFLIMALLYHKQHISQFKTLIQRVVKHGSHTSNGYLFAKAVIFALTDIWIKDHDPLTNKDKSVKLRLATINPLYWFTYELCLQQFITSDELVAEIRNLGGESIQGKKCSHLFDFLNKMATECPGEYLILAIMEIMRYVKYNVQVISFTLNFFQSTLLDLFKNTTVNFSKGVFEIVCYCRQTFDWGFMSMLIYSIDAILMTDEGMASKGSSEHELARCMLAGGFMDYLRWKLQQIRDVLPQGDVTRKIFVPKCSIVAEIFCILNHVIGTCDELLDLFQTFDEQYKTLNHYRVLLLPLYEAIRVRSEGGTHISKELLDRVQTCSTASASIYARDKMGKTKTIDTEVYNYLIFSEDIEGTTKRVVDLIFGCRLHQSIITAVRLLNADGKSTRAQAILDSLLRKYVNRLAMVLRISTPPDFCLHTVTTANDDKRKLGPRLTMLAQFTGKLLSSHLMAAHCDSLYMVFRVLIEAVRRGKMVFLEFAIEAVRNMGNLLCYPVFTRLFIAEEVICRLFPRIVEHTKEVLEGIDANIFEIRSSKMGTVVLEETQCLKKFDTKGRGGKGLTILKQSPAVAYEFEPDRNAVTLPSNNASALFSIVNLAANIEYRALPTDNLWFQDQLTMDLTNHSLDDLLAILKIEFDVPPNALEIMSIVEMTLSNKNFVTHVEQLVSNGYVDWLLFILYRYVLIRGYTHFRDCIVFMATLGGARMLDAMVKLTAYCLNVFLKYIRSCRDNTIYRKLLSVSSGWMGAITLGRNKPLLTKHLDLKYLILYAYQNGLLTVVIPAVCKLMINVKSSKIFRLPNPWTSSVLNLLADIAMSNGLKSTLQFDLSLLFRNLDLVQRPRYSTSQIKDVPVMDSDRSPKLGVTMWSPRAPNAMGLGMSMLQLEFQVQPVSQDVRELLKRKIAVNPKVSCLNTKWPWVEMVLNAIETCYMESSELIKKTMLTCVTTTRSMIVTDFASCKRDILDVNPEMLKMSATAMASGLAASLIMATAREQLNNLMSLRLHMQILSLLSMEPTPADAALTTNLEQVSGFLAKDNLGLVCALVEQATLELITGYISASIGEWMSGIRSDNVHVEPDLTMALQANIGLDAYNRFGTLVPFAMTRLQTEKQQGMPQQTPCVNVIPGGMPGFVMPHGNTTATDSAPPGFTQTNKPRVPGPQFRLPDYMIIPPIDNLPTSLIACKVEEFEQRVKETAKIILTHPPTIPLLNSKYLYSADSSTLLLLSCLPKNHTLFTLLWSMDYIFQNAANQAECVEALINRVLKTSRENTKGLDVISIVQEAEYCLLEMVSIGCPLVNEIVTNLIPSFGPSKLCQFVRYGVLKIPAVDRFIGSQLDPETLCRTMHKLILDGQWLTAADLPISMNKLATLDPSGKVQIHMATGPVTVEFGELHRRLAARVPLMIYTNDTDNRTNNRMMTGPPAGLTIQQGVHGNMRMQPGHRHTGTPMRLRSLRQLVTEKSLARNKMVVKLSDIPGKERYIKIFQDYLMSVDADLTPLLQNFNEHTPDAFLTSTLMFALQMTFEPLTTEIRLDRLPQNCHESPVWTYCDGWSLMVSRLSRNENFILHKALHLLLGVMQHGVVYMCYERILVNLINEMESNQTALTSLGYFLTLCGPSEMPEFGEYWINLISRKPFVQQVIQNPNEWPLYHQLLIEALTSQHAKTPAVSFILVTLMQKVPEFLCGYYLSLCDVVPPRAMQLRNMLTCAVPRSFKLPNPIMMCEHIDIPSLNFTNHIITVLKVPGLKAATDMFVYEPDDALVHVVMKELKVLDPSTFDVVLANHYVLYLITTLPTILKKIPASRHFANNSLLLLEKVMLNCISQARHMLLSCMTNHLRYPNTSTFAFVTFMLRLFSNGERPIQEQITLALLERLLVSRPHPWGVLHLLFQLVENPKYDFWNRLQATPEVEKHIRRIIQGCVTSKTPPHPNTSANNEHFFILMHSGNYKIHEPEITVGNKQERGWLLIDMPFGNFNQNAVVMGYEYDIYNEKATEKLKKRVEQFILLTYRKGLQIKIPSFYAKHLETKCMWLINSKHELITTDYGWGCALRATQMAMAEALQATAGVDDINNMEKKQIVKLFYDTIQAPFSIENLVMADTEIGACKELSYDEEESLKKLFATKWFRGMVGGEQNRPRAYYFVGHQANMALYLDPHEYIAKKLDESNDMPKITTKRLNKLKWNHLNQSKTLCFTFKVRYTHNKAIIIKDNKDITHFLRATTRPHLRTLPFEITYET
ncbi:CCR4-NOT transcription complex subunit 1 [Babesia sp. Xinjiang]|uniref:CCR4-NOT transcription complex subunit 1 n=1 Tax=Babesia sp. Xinjiang TaxID=462227 RepID=UPI000A258826|nr:CCR4-NOT transcription complex subunit 1 [Babesia sp. Xinjiang]ORM41704.1 CCR4-NOT transcription complex subunit 1 [Babesia sp. Xinjiang]